MFSKIAPDSYHLYRPFSWIKAEGEDAPEFLQSQFSNDLSGLKTGDAKYGLWLDQKGKVHGDSWVLRAGEESYYLFSYYSPADGILKKLESFIVADDVELEDLSDQVAGVSLFGKAIEAFQTLQAEGDLPVDCKVLPGRRGAIESLDVIVSNEGRDPLLSLFRERGIVVEVNDAVINLLRILSKFPRIPEDIGPRELPQEGGLEVSGVSFNKGCYLGQEVMSRLHSMGQVRRSLQLIESKEAIPYEAALTLEGKKIGISKSSIKYDMRYVGLALLSNTADPSKAFDIESGGSGKVMVQPSI